MLKMFTISAVLAAFVATTVSTAIAVPRKQDQSNASRATKRQIVPESGASRYQTEGSIDDMGAVPPRR